MVLHGLVQYNPPPYLRLLPHPTPSLATVAVTSITVPIVQTTAKLHHITGWSLITQQKPKRRCIGWRGIVRESHPVPPWEWRKRKQ